MIEGNKEPDKNQISDIQGTVIKGEIPEDSRPIDKWTWFKLSRTWVTGSEERIKGQVDRLQSSISWFFGLGSSAAILGLFLKSPQMNLKFSLLLCITILSLLVAYACATLAITAINRSVEEPNIDSNIRKAFNKTNKQSKRLIIASSSLFIIGLSVFPFALLSSIEKKDPPPVETKFADISARLILKKEGNSDTLVFITGIDVSGFTPDSSMLKFKLENGGNSYSAVVIDSFKHVINHGKFDYTIMLENKRKFNENSKYYLNLIYRYKEDSLCNKKVLIQR
ncbi:hypothetical protein [Chitinophaga sp. LS1]|uniref:hypothetical protein n=1 Tax=Chitinophaga sp. LS1 TaxID=3051176 RepID=UPI002AAB9F82|nr:hypothetical protein [Chitinophaga sp. LS1]WPV70600.1 hypothetical protein QQL36_17970 [Chitinophaga sp. LS1]